MLASACGCMARAKGAKALNRYIAAGLQLLMMFSMVLTARSAPALVKLACTASSLINCDLFMA
jgi:hypothetical protein